MKTISYIFLFAILTTAAFAGEKIQILKADVIGEERYVDLFLELNDAKDAEKLHVTEYQNGELFGQTVFDGAEVNEGVLLLAIKSHEVLKLISPNFTPEVGGNVILDFLYNGISGSRGSLDVDLVREGDEWQVYKNNVKISKLSIKKKKVLGKEVGIKRIEYN